MLVFKQTCIALPEFYIKIIVCTKTVAIASVRQSPLWQEILRVLIIHAGGNRLQFFGRSPIV